MIDSSIQDTFKGKDITTIYLRTLHKYNRALCLRQPRLIDQKCSRDIEQILETFLRHTAQFRW